MTNPIPKLQAFFTETALELKRCSWPTRRDLLDSTAVVIVTVLLFGVFVASADWVFVTIIRFLTGTA